MEDFHEGSWVVRVSKGMYLGKDTLQFGIEAEIERIKDRKILKSVSFPKSQSLERCFGSVRRSPICLFLVLKQGHVCDFEEDHLLQMKISVA